MPTTVDRVRQLAMRRCLAAAHDADVARIACLAVDEPEETRRELQTIVDTLTRLGDNLRRTAGDA